MLIECIGCLEVKDEGEFHRSKVKINGRTSRCKVCRAAQMKVQREIPEVAEARKAQTKAYREIPEVKEKKAEYQQTDVGRASQKKSNDKRHATPEGQQKDKARAAVGYAVETGRMLKPERCSLYFPFYPICKGQIEGHHYKGYDPEHWLDVEWICRYHHDMSDKLAEHTLTAIKEQNYAH